MATRDNAIGLISSPQNNCPAPAFEIACCSVHFLVLHLLEAADRKTEQS
jgi:hypothetical protein